MYHGSLCAALSSSATVACWTLERKTEIIYQIPKDILNYMIN